MASQAALIPADEGNDCHADGNRQYHFPLMIVVSLMFMGLGIKSGLFPFHSALPTAYGSTMTTSNGILSGLVLKAYIILAIKLVFEVFTIEHWLN